MNFTTVLTESLYLTVLSATFIHFTSSQSIFLQLILYSYRTVHLGVQSDIFLSNFSANTL